MKSFLEVQLAEVLSKDADAGKWIDDFVKSDNPKFAGKSKEKRKQMALAVYYAKQKNESVQESDEAWAKSMEKQRQDRISDKDKGTLGKIADLMAKEKKPVKEETEQDKAKKDLDLKLSKWKNQQRAGKALEKEAVKQVRGDDGLQYESTDMDKSHIEQHLADKDINASVSGNKVKVHSSDVAATKKHLTKAGYKHEVVGGLNEEQIDEISKDTLNSYIHKSFARGNEIHKQVDDVQSPEERAKLKAELSKRNTGVIKAAKKLRNEEVISFADYLKESVELTEGTVQTKKYNWGTMKTVHHGHDFSIPLHPENHKPIAKLKDGQEHHFKDETGKHWGAYRRGDHVHFISADHSGKYKTTVKHTTLHESVELDEADTSAKQYVIHVQKGKHYLGHKEIYNGNQRIEIPKEKSDELYSKGATRIVHEEAEQIDELSKQTLASYIHRAADSARDKGINVGFNSDKKAAVKDFVKSASRVKNIGKAAQKLAKEEVEELDELDKKTLGSYINKSHDQLMKHHGSVNMKYGRGDKDATAYALDKDALRKTANRTQGMKTAISKLTKEHVLTYAEFMASLEEGKADDIKDRLAAAKDEKKDRYEYDDAKDTKASPVQKVKGHSYGAGEEEGEDEGAEHKPVQPVAAKRSRGRPSGAKSGARI